LGKTVRRGLSVREKGRLAPPLFHLNLAEKKPMTDAKPVTAAILIIGDEILSGRTRDSNVGTIATYLAPFGIDVVEVRIVTDHQDAIVVALNALRTAYTYVFTTGGIGPTHDDITADAVAAAFGVGISHRADAVAILTARYGATDLNEARLRMARIPDGAILIANPVSGAPGFQIGNVFVMAGVPGIMTGMLQDIGHRLETGSVVHTVTWRGANLREGAIAASLGQLAKDMPAVSFGSYPWFDEAGHGAHIVARSRDTNLLATASDAVVAIIKATGVVPEAV
jgi:molybdopterin-biosynthesis enzyme MoeA-like protein